ncbi:hypothetical protein Patl1_31753 [Pistacia atlantica]|uniref:Uncharacterized protein n=1 Tax=Pistacia atlantica TaxID=434234 RepID=A0ACC1AQH6_9ROSI|nr:hypothetical protein Patl1_31753 [Pistacia atlantica]
MILSCTTLTYPPSVIAFPKFQFRVVFKPALRELLNSLKEKKGPFQLPTCVIADVLIACGFASIFPSLLK